MKIAYVTTFDIQNPESWPKRHVGLYRAGSKSIKSLQADGTTLHYLGQLQRPRNPITRLKWQFYRNVFKQDFYSWADPLVQGHYARQIAQKLSGTGADLLLCPENAIPLAAFNPSCPTVLWTDAALGSLVDFYPYLSNLCSETRHNLFKMERQVFERCSLIIMNSPWAAESAASLYDIPLAKIKVIPGGAEQIHQFSPEDLNAFIAQRKAQPCRILFVGVEWGRKGGDTAFRVVQALNDKGVAAELHVVGCEPPEPLPEFVKVHGFIDRSTAAGKAKIEQLFQSSHFLIYPTRADALGMVLSEAGSFGLPALASRVGGIPSLVKAHVTGQTFPLESDPSTYCEFVIPYMTDIHKYQSLARSTFESYRNHMSWPAVGEMARCAFRELLA